MMRSPPWAANALWPSISRYIRCIRSYRRYKRITIANWMPPAMNDSATVQVRNVPAHGVPFGEAMKVWARVAALSFGGPAGQIAVMHRIIVEEKKWIGEQRFLQALNYCTLLPGPEAQQLATYIG